MKWLSTLVVIAATALLFAPRAASTSTEAARGEVGSPQHVLVIGDSITWQSQTQIEDLLIDRELSGEITVVTRSVSGSGLASPNFFDWEAEARRMAQTFAPDVVVIEFAGNCDPAAPQQCGTSQYFVEWERAARAVTATFREHGATVVWVTPIAMPTPEWNNRATMINALLESMTTDGTIRLADARSVFGGPNYSSTLPRIDGTWVEVRSADKVHLTLEGSALLADVIVRTIVPLIDE